MVVKLNDECIISSSQLLYSNINPIVNYINEKIVLLLIKDIQLSSIIINI